MLQHRPIGRTWMLSVTITAGICLLTALAQSATAADPKPPTPKPVTAKPADPKTTDAVAAPATAKPLEASFIPADTAFAAVAHPRQVLTSPDFEMLPIEVISATTLQEVGFDVAELDEVIAIAIPGPGFQKPEFGVILRFAHAYDRTKVLAKMLAGAETVVFDNKKYMLIPGRNQWCAWLIDDRTVLVGTEVEIKKMLAVHEASGAMVKLLKSADTSRQIMAVIAVDAIRDDIVKQLAKMPAVPPAFADLMKLPEQLSSVELSMDVKSAISGTLILRVRDAKTAADVEHTVLDALKMAQQMILAQCNRIAASTDPVDIATRHYSQRFIGKLFAIIKPQRIGDRVEIDWRCESIGLATVGIMLGMLLPAVSAARSGHAQRIGEQFAPDWFGSMSYEATKRTYPPAPLPTPMASRCLVGG